MYITRNIEQTINRISSRFKVLLLTGARQVGKTTLLKHLAQGSGRTYVTLDDLYAVWRLVTQRCFCSVIRRRY